MQCVIVCTLQTGNVNLNASNAPPAFIQKGRAAGGKACRRKRLYLLFS